MLDSLRQLKYHKEFRIKPPAWSCDILDMLEKTVARINIAETEPSSGTDAKEHFKFLSELGTGLWRMRKSIVPEGSSEPAEENRRTFRHLESVWDALSEQGVEIKNHTGDVVVGGEALKIIAFQPTSGLIRDQVIETIRPTIYYRGKMIQTGEVIVGKPE